MNTIFLFLLVTSLFFNITQCTNLRFPVQEPDFIQVVGVHVENIDPDFVRVQLAVTNIGTSSSHVQYTTNSEVNQVMQVLKTSNVTDLSTDSMSLYPNYDYERSPPSITGYTSSQGISFSIVPWQVGPTLSKVIALNVTEVSSVQGFASTSLRNATYLKAIELSIKDAQVKADVVAKALGLCRGQPTKTIVQDTGFVPGPPIMPFMALKEEISPTFIPSKESISSSVQVTFLQMAC
jgi:uncharacterized protein